MVTPRKLTKTVLSVFQRDLFCKRYIAKGFVVKLEFNKHGSNDSHNGRFVKGVAGVKQ